MGYEQYVVGAVNPIAVDGKTRVAGGVPGDTMDVIISQDGEVAGVELGNWLSVTI